jgi:hypothetical protein
MRASHSADEIQTIALVAAAKPDVTPALVDVLNKYRTRLESPLFRLRAQLWSGVGTAS